MKKTVNIPIQKKWFDMILSGEKKEEYREIKPYWWKRLGVKMDMTENGRIRKWSIAEKIETVTLINGYGHDKPRIVVDLLDIEIKIPEYDWSPIGTEGLWFALVLGEIIEKHNIADTK